MRTLCRELVPPVFMVAMVAHAFSVEFGIDMWTTSYFLLFFCTRNWFFFRNSHDCVFLSITTFVGDEFLFRESLELNVLD